MTCTGLTTMIFKRTFSTRLRCNCHAVMHAFNSVLWPKSMSTARFVRVCVWSLAECCMRTRSSWGLELNLQSSLSILVRNASHGVNNRQCWRPTDYRSLFQAMWRCNMFLQRLFWLACLYTLCQQGRVTKLPSRQGRFRSGMMYIFTATKGIQIKSLVLANLESENFTKHWIFFVCLPHKMRMQISCRRDAQVQ